MRGKTIVLVLFIIFAASPLFSQGPDDQNFGFGVSLGDPMAGTIKYWVNDRSAYNLTVGDSYFGSPRFGLDYNLHFQTFDTEFIQLYAGPGVIFGLGNASPDAEDPEFYDIAESELGIAVRAIIGFTIVPDDFPFEFFLEMGPLVGLAPETGAAFDYGLGFRFYP